MDEREYEEVFHKDNRNMKGTVNAKKRTNVKEVARRLAQIEKRNAPKMEDHYSSDELPEEEEESKGKYGNGKPPRVLKVQ